MQKVQKEASQGVATCVLEAELGKLDIKRREPRILFISLQVDLLSKLAIMTWRHYLVSCRFNVIGDITQKQMQRHDDLIKAHVVR